MHDFGLCVVQADHKLASITAVAVEVLIMWLRTVLDDGKRNALKYFTLVLPSYLLKQSCNSALQ